MPAILAALGSLLLSLVGSAVGQVVAALGVGVVAYTGMSTTLDWLKTQLIANFSALPVEVLGMLSVMKVGQCISIVFSAIAIRLLISGMTGGTVKRWVTK